MNPRLRKAIACFAILAFLIAYIWAAVSIGDYVPDVWWAKVIYYAVIGFAWWLPLIPLVSWAEGRVKAPVQASGRAPLYGRVRKRPKGADEA
jgi:hypothetical protein